MSWLDDKRWADKFQPEIERVIRGLAGQIITFGVASDTADRHEATDYVIEVNSGTIACRIRDGLRSGFRDLTLRYRRASGVRTEWEKIRAGFARWYLYAWAGKAFDYAFIDLDVARAKGLLDLNRGKPQSNRDGATKFLAFPLLPFGRAGALVETTLPAPAGARAHEWPMPNPSHKAARDAAVSALARA